MNKHFRLLLKFFLCALANLLLLRSSFASFSPLAVGARASGMGEAFTAAADDVTSLYYNPAGLANLERPELGAYYSRLYMGLTDGSNISRSFVGYGQPLGSASTYGTLGIDYIDLDLSNLYEEQTFGMSYAYQFIQKLNIGASFKLLRKSIGTGDPSATNAIDSTTGQPFSSPQSDPLTASAQSKSAPAIDLGAQYELFHHYWVAAAFRNINSPNMAIGGGDSDPAPAYSTIGIARKSADSTLDLDVSQYNTTVDNIHVSVGGEKWLDAIGLRAGLAFGTQDFAAGSFGASYRFKNFQMDYAMNLPLEGVQGTFGNQQLSLTVRFGEKPQSILEKQIVEERKLRLQAEAKTIRLRNERDRLKTQIRQLTEGDDNTSNAVGPNAAAVKNSALESSIATAKKSINQSNTSAGNRQAIAGYSKEIEAYQEAYGKPTQANLDANLPARVDSINKIISKYKKSGVDLTAANKESAYLTKTLNEKKYQYALSMKFYSKLVENGSSIDDRKTMIELIIKKYKIYGFDITKAQDELKRISQPTAN